LGFRRRAGPDRGDHFILALDRIFPVRSLPAKPLEGPSFSINGAPDGDIEPMMIENIVARCNFV
jgi:hypothetical protein